MIDMDKKYILGLDTSNYTTSVALTDENFNIIEDRRKPIKVKDGMKGIRQSEALFQHMKALPHLLEDILEPYKSEIRAVCASSRPRPVENSYMPVFMAGMNFGKVVADALGVSLYLTSHQEGHIEAGLINEYGISDYRLASQMNMAVFHLSGGTTEILNNDKIVGGTKDISFGQLLDRIGVKAGFSFPAGGALDRLAFEYLESAGDMDRIRTETLEIFKYISREGLYINLSGLNTQVERLFDKDLNKRDLPRLTASVFYLIGHCLKTLTIDLQKQYNVKEVIFVGGVSSSKFIRTYLTKEKEIKNSRLKFSIPELSTDNAVGVAVIGGKKEWHSNP